MVINYIGKMVRRIPIPFHENKVLLGLFLLERPVDSILELWRAEASRVKPNDMGFALGGSLIGLRARQSTTCARVSRRFASVVKSSLLGFEDSLITEATICRTIFE